MNSGLLYFPKSISSKAIVTFIIALLLCTIVFRNHLLPWLWVLFGFIEVIGFFWGLSFFSKKWSRISSKVFIRNLFWVSFILRVIWVVFSYYFFIENTGIPFDFEAADSFSYHNWALIVSDNFSKTGFQQIFSSDIGYSDFGFPIYLTFVYYLFDQSIIIARLLFALWGAVTCVLVYRLAKRNFGENVGRIAGIMTLLLTNLIYYTGLHLKEPIMVFLIVAFIERSDALIREYKFKFFDFSIVIALGISLFFFRTALGIAGLFALFTGVMFYTSKYKNWIKQLLIVVWMMVFLSMFLSVRIQYEIEYLLQNIDSQEENLQYRSARDEGNKLATYGSRAVFAPVILMAPIPTFVNIEHQQQQMLLSGGNFIRNIYAFFVIIALIQLFKRKVIRKHLLILSFTLSYLAILLQSPFALSERFHQPVVPFLLILAAYGVTQINKKNMRYYVPYLVLVVIIIVGWNWFKLAGRGMI